MFCAFLHVGELSGRHLDFTGLTKCFRGNWNTNLQITSRFEAALAAENHRGCQIYFDHTCKRLLPPALAVAQTIVADILNVYSPFIFDPHKVRFRFILGVGRMVSFLIWHFTAVYVMFKTLFFQ